MFVFSVLCFPSFFPVILLKYICFLIYIILTSLLLFHNWIIYPFQCEHKQWFFVHYLHYTIFWDGSWCNKMDQDVICAKCNKVITRVAPIRCGGCDLPYHPSCASQLPTISNGSFARCCKPRSTSPSNSQSSQSSHKIDALILAVDNRTKKVSENFWLFLIFWFFLLLPIKLQIWSLLWCLIHS